VEEGTVPLAKALEEASDEVDRAGVEQRERQLLYVAMTRAREQLLMTSVGPPSRFLTPEIWKESHSTDPS
jgi:superfamily I DNA/RNA helicase